MKQKTKAQNPLKKYERMLAARQARTSLPPVIRGSLVAIAVVCVAMLLPYVISLPCKPGTLLLASLLIALCAGVYVMHRHRCIALILRVSLPDARKE
ncbi:hypothetical protein [Photorhabdus sp. RM71S]|uniref:hypothetical protein n=1 Tax=Photorhabdus sp. RM71S TaxID=3342824 RepID=UPI0036DEF195